MRSLLFKIWPILIFIFVTILFFKPFFLEGKLPIPADTIVGMYHPWRDFYSQEYPNGIPFKNFLITDPVRQQYVWRHLAIESIKNGQLPLWNPYNFSGTPLLANFQSAPFYPLNILFFVLPFSLAWAILVLLQPLLAGIFLYAYLRNLRISQWASLIGASAFSFSGFSVAWLEWNTILHTALWLPLILLAIDKIFFYKKLLWSSIFVFSLASSFFAGHLQIFFYLFTFSLVYFLVRWWQYGKPMKIILLFTIYYLLFTILTAVQWWPTLQFISLSAREFDLPNWQSSSWFLPAQNLVQFLAPDFFGNPATLNYWGEWNYGEFVGYIGIVPLVFCLVGLFYRHDKKIWFFSGVVMASLVLALPTPLAKLPYQWQIPLISTSQPTRLLFLIDFSLAVLAALGLDWLIKSFDVSNRQRKIIKIIVTMFMVLLGLWVFILGSPVTENLQIARRNLILPTIIFVFSAGLLYIYHILIYDIRAKKIILSLFLFLVVFDLFRFGWKFTPFSKEEWLFPQTETIKFLKNQPKPFRFMTTDRRIFPPNFATFYRLEDISGYDPLYLKNYGELVAAWNRGEPDISPLSFNRILTPQDYSSKIADLLNVKYILSLKEEISPKLELIFQEGQTRVYENKNVYPRAFLVYDYKIAKDRQEAINLLFDEEINLQKTAILEAEPGMKLKGEDRKGEVKIVLHEAQKIVIKTRSLKPAILVLADNFYPGWQAFLDGKGESEKTYRVDFALRGVIVPEGEHQIEFYPSL